MMVMKNNHTYCIRQPPYCKAEVPRASLGSPQCSHVPSLDRLSEACSPVFVHKLKLGEEQANQSVLDLSVKIGDIELAVRVACQQSMNAVRAGCAQRISRYDRYAYAGF